MELNIYNRAGELKETVSPVFIVTMGQGDRCRIRCIVIFQNMGFFHARRERLHRDGGM